MNVRKLSVNKACIFFAVLLLVAMGTVSAALYGLTQNITAVWYVLLFGIFVLVCAVCFILDRLYDHICIDAARDGDSQAVDQVLRYYEGYINKLCTRTLYDPDGQPHVRVDEYMKRRLEIKLIYSIVNMS